MVMSDWLGGENAVAQMEAGNDLLMPGKLSQREEIRKAVLNGHLSLDIVDRNVRHVLEYILRTNRFKGATPDNNPNLAEHGRVARAAAAEGMVLLKNTKQTLPLSQKVRNVALFGRSSYDFIAGGSGSGNVNHAYVVSLLEGLENAGFRADTALRAVYENYLPKAKAQLVLPDGPFAALLPKPLVPEMSLDDAALLQAAKNNDMAVVTIGKTSGEFADRKLADDFNLSAAEQSMLDKVSRVFHCEGKKVVVILNVCGVVETKSWADKADAILLAWLPGQEGGNSVADVLVGKESPSGRLPMTWPMAYSDVPSKDCFPLPDSISTDLLTSSMAMAKDSVPREPIPNFDYTEYRDGIYVGYRHYTTRRLAVSYPFGYGLSYTAFKYGKPQATVDTQGNVTVTVRVTNTGKTAGKEVVQVYVSAPGRDMDKPERELRGFQKTRCLQPGEAEDVTVTIPYESLASFNEAESQWQVEEGDYKVMVAKHAADTDPLVSVVHERAGVTQKVRPCLLEEQK